MRTTSGWWLALLLAAGCTDDGTGDSGADDTSPGDDTAQADDTGPTDVCAHTATSPGERIAGLVIEHDLAEGAAAWVSFSVDGATYEGPRQETAGSVKHIVLGPKPGESTDYTLHIEADGEVAECAGSADVLPIDDPNLPEFVITAPLPDALADRPWFFGVSLETGERSLTFMVDREGEYLFARWGDPDFIETVVYLMDDGAGNGQVVSLRVPHSHDPADCFVLIEDILGETSSTISTPAGHHDIVKLPDGRIAVVTAQAQEAGPAKVPVVADGVVAYDASGAAETIFSLWDYTDPTPQGHSTDFFKLGEDWSHGNDVSYYPETGTMLFSVAQQDMTIEFDPVTGEALRQFGGEGGYTPIDLDTSFQHNPVFTDAGTLMLFTKVSDGDEAGTGPVEYEISDDEQTLTPIWSYGESETSFVLGKNERYENGNTYAVWGHTGVSKEITPAGEVAWTFDAAEGWFFGRVHPLQTPYPWL